VNLELHFISQLEVYPVLPFFRSLLKLTWKFALTMRGVHFVLQFTRKKNYKKTKNGSKS
jgi:hypothetical protein